MGFRAELLSPLQLNRFVFVGHFRKQALDPLSSVRLCGNVPMEQVRFRSSSSVDNQLEPSRNSAFDHYQRRSTTPSRPGLQVKNGLEKSQSAAVIFNEKKGLGKCFFVD
jgi:hypothetical protein